MSNVLNQSTRLLRLTRTQFLSIFAITAVLLAATFLHADSGGTQPEHNTLAGTVTTDFCWFDMNKQWVEPQVLTTANARNTWSYQPPGQP